MTDFTINNGVISADGVAIMPKMAYFEDEGSASSTKITSFLNSRADGTDLQTMKYNFIFAKIHTTNSVTTTWLNLAQTKGIWAIGEHNSPGSGLDYPTHMTAYKDHPAFAGYIANYTRQEDYKTPTGYATGAVYPYFDDLGNSQCRQTANKGYRTAFPNNLKFGPQSGTPPPTRNGRNTVVNESQKGVSNAYYAHENTKFFIGSNKLTFATTYRWVDDAKTSVSGWAEDNTTNNPMLGYNRYKVPWGLFGYQVYGVNRNTGASDYLYYIVRPYAGLKALVANNIINGQLITCPMAVLGFYQLDPISGDPWGMPSAPIIRNQIYQALCGGAKALGYYSYANFSGTGWISLNTVTPDRRLEIGYCHDELALRAITSSGQRDGETYEKHILLGVHTYHTCTGSPSIPTQITVEGGTPEPFVVASSFYLGTTKLIMIVNRHPTSTYTNVTFRLDQGTNFLGIKHTGTNFNLQYAGLARKTPTGTFSLGADGVTVNLSTIAGAEVVLLQATTTSGGSGGEVVEPTAGRSSLVVKSTNLSTANTNAPDDLGNASDTTTWSSTLAKAFTVYNRGQLNLWASTTAYALNKQIRTSGNRWYVCTVAGTSSSTEPTHTSGTASDGTVTWLYLGTITSSTYYIADASLNSTQKLAVDARSYLINYHYERQTQGNLTGSTSRYARSQVAQQFSYSMIRDDISRIEFNPSDYGTSLGYYDFGALDKVFNASGVAGVNGDAVDKVEALAGTAFGDARQTTASLRPVLQGKQLNGRSVLSWQGTDNNLYLQFPSGRGAIKNLGGITVVTVFKLSAVGANQRVHTITVAGTNDSRNVMVIDSSNRILIGGRRQTSAEAFTSITGATALSVDTWYIVMATYNYSTQAGQIWLNNVSDATGNICATAGTIDNTDSFSDPILGRDAAGSQDFQGYIACWGVYSGVLATQGLTALYHYYKTIYNL